MSGLGYYRTDRQAGLQWVRLDRSGSGPVPLPATMQVVQEMRVISRKMWVLAFAVLVPGVAAAAPSADWQLTGEQLIMAGIDGSLAPEFHDEKRPELQVMVSSSRAAAFMLGVASYTHGTRWCKADGLGQEDFAKVVETLGSLPDDRLKTPAAPLVAQALAEHFPCRR